MGILTLFPFGDLKFREKRYKEASLANPPTIEKPASTNLVSH